MAELSTETLPATSFGRDHTHTDNHTGCAKLHAPEVTIKSVSLLICLLGLVGNGIVIWFLGFHMKRNPFTVYVLNLAVADSGFLLCSAALVAHKVGNQYCDSTGVEVFIIFTVLCFWTYNTSLYLLTAISIHRCMSVLYPIWYRCRRPQHLSAIVSALLWAFSFLLCCSLTIFCIGLTQESCITSLLFVFVLNVLIFSPIMVLSSLSMFIKVRRSSQRRPPGKLYVVILLTVLFFLLFTLPHSVVFFLPSHGIFLDNWLFEVLACASSSINPVIYFLVGSYRKRRHCGSLKLALQRVFEEQADSREDRNDPSRDTMETAV
nr:mas-related G-protein coupled receptor member H-like [Pelodiscus sinensis]|eukprot:XP_006110404.1 mas-related G-protein coupled receptor member H-like [Pelodiscus sinensis]